MKIRYCIYRFIDKDNNIIYIGKTCSENPQWRFNQHSCNGHLDKECYDSIDKIEICELSSHANVNVYEPYLINLYKPKYNDDFKTDDYLVGILLPELEWYDKDEYITMIKIENNKEKNTTNYQENKADSRLNKVKGYDEFINWYNKWDGSIIKASKIKSICNIDTKQWETLKKNKSIKSKLDILLQSKRGQYSKV